MPVEVPNALHLELGSVNPPNSNDSRTTIADRNGKGAEDH